jgi:hypothetical protein
MVRLKLGYYTQSGINPKPGQRVIDVIKEYGVYSVNERQNDFGVAITRAFPFDAKTIRFCGSFKRWGIETFVPYRFNSESKT